MIEHIDIKNVALIKEGSIDFSEKLNIISGETGAGKSMVIDAINFMLGKKAGKDFIRLGEDKAAVSGLFTIENDDVALELEEKGIAVGEDKSVLIERIITESGKGSIKANGKTISLVILKEISSLLVDVHGQHDHQSLLNPAKHMEILDVFCPEELKDKKAELSDYLKEYKDLSKKAADIVAKSGKSGEKLEDIKFEIDEIENAKLYAEEEEMLSERHKTLLHSEKLKENSSKIIDALYNDMEEASVLTMLNQCLRLAGEIADMDKEAAYIFDSLQGMSIDLEDMKRDISAYSEGIDSDGYELKEVEARLELIYSLKRKYGRSVSDILDYWEKAKEEYSSLINADKILAQINSRRKALNGEITGVCEKMRKIRKTTAKAISAQIEGILRELGMKDACFEISVEQKKEFGANGNDTVTFLISPNLGEPLKELSKIASGGEMSRVMLAMKTVISTADSIETFIFDEIDTGVSGRTAQKVAEKLCLIASIQQIICITHLPQIAAMGDAHLLIEKTTDEERTLTRVNNLDKEAQVREIARLLGGAKITDAALANADELKNMADSYKQGIIK